MSILDIFTKKNNRVAGLHIDSYGRFQCIELEKINTSYSPVFTESGVLENFANDGVFRKKRFIKYFKDIRGDIASPKLYLNVFENKKLENEVTSALKIAGFEHVSVVPDKNIEGIILSSRFDFERMTVWFHDDVITFYTTEHGEIVRKKTINNSEFGVSAATRLCNHLEQKHIYLAGAASEMTEAITGVFYQAGIKVHIYNVWENFLNFADGVPEIFIDESQSFIDVLSLTVPDLKIWKVVDDVPLENEQKKEKKLESVSLNKKVFLPKPKKKNKQKKNQAANTIHTLKNTSKKRGSANKTVITKEKGLDYTIEPKKKFYLPKRKKKVFLPKPKKNSLWKKMKNILYSEI